MRAYFLFYLLLIIRVIILLLYIIHYTLYIIHYTLYIIKSELYTLYIIQLHNQSYILYSSHSISSSLRLLPHSKSSIVNGPLSETG